MASIATRSPSAQTRSAALGASRRRGARAVRASPADRPDPPAAPYRRVLADAQERPVGLEPARPGSKAQAGALHDALGPALDATADLGVDVGPAEEGVAGDQRRPGQVVEQQVERGPGLDLARKFRRDGLAQTRAGAAADKAIQPGHGRIGLEALDIALAARQRRELGRRHDPRRPAPA